MRSNLNTFQFIETILQETNAPPCVIIDQSYNVVYIHGKTGIFFEPAEGRASMNILEMSRPGLKAELSKAINSTSASHKEQHIKAVKIQLDKEFISVDLTVKPVLQYRNTRGLIMIIFQKNESFESSNKIEKKHEKEK